MCKSKPPDVNVPSTTLLILGSRQNARNSPDTPQKFSLRIIFNVKFPDLRYIHRMFVFCGCLLSQLYSNGGWKYTVTRILVLKFLINCTKILWFSWENWLRYKPFSSRNYNSMPERLSPLCALLPCMHGRFAGLHQCAVQVCYHSVSPTVCNSSSLFCLPNSSSGFNHQVPCI